MIYLTRGLISHKNEEEHRYCGGASRRGEGLGGPSLRAENRKISTLPRGFDDRTELVIVQSGMG
ncbi:conserved hypothetical protein, partial [delta proteobacterium NaphS2]